MPRRRNSGTHKTGISPLNPSLHFIIFLVMAFILVMIVAAVMQQVTTSTRARLVCPQSQTDERALVQQLSQQCSNGVEYGKDANGCGVWTCKTP